MLGLIIGVASVILLVSIGSGLQSFVTEQFASLGSNTLWIMPGEVNMSQGPDLLFCLLVNLNYLMFRILLEEVILSKMRHPW